MINGITTQINAQKAAASKGQKTNTTSRKIPDYGIFRSPLEDVVQQGNKKIYRDASGAITKIVTYTLDPNSQYGVKETITDAYGKPIKNN